MTRIAIFGDVHANRPALETVVAAIADAGVDRMLCLGDIVGYHAEPAACIDVLRALGVASVAGNHDLAVLGGPRGPGTAASALRVQDWTRRCLSADRIEWLAALPRMVYDVDFVAVHGCFLDPSSYAHGYVTATMLERNLRAVRSLGARLAFCGHTHIPMAAWLAGDVVTAAIGRGDVQWPAEADAVLVNPGSVGQPRDGDPWASFALVDTETRTARFTRVPYDVAAAIDAIDRADLPTELGQRLRAGR